MKRRYLASAVLAPFVFSASHALAQTEANGDTQVSEVVVTASPLGSSRERFATLVEVLNRRQILENGGNNLADTLAEVPGVASSGFASGAGRPVIRGMDASRVKILEGGLSSLDVADVGPDHGVPVDPLSAQRIEVVRGAASLRYGSQAIGGVVNVINNRIPLTLGEKPFSGEASASYGSVADTGEASILLDGTVGQFAFHADGFVRDADDYDTPLGVLTNSFFSASGYSAGASYFVGEGSRTGLAVTHFESEYGIPAEDTFIDLRQTKVVSSSSLSVSAGPLRMVNLDVSYADYVHDEVDPAGPAILSTFKNYEVDGRAEALFGELGPLSASALGLQVQRRSFSALGEGGDFLFPTLTRSAAVFAFTEAPLSDQLILQGAVRAERVEVEGTPVSNVLTERRFNPISGSASLTFAASDTLKFGLTLASAARAPAQTELFARGPHDGPVTFEIGDPTLDIERSNSVEATMRSTFGKVRVEAAVWAAHFDDYIYGNLTGVTVDEDGNPGVGAGFDLNELNFVQRDARFRGAEAKTVIPLFEANGSALSATLQADYVRAEFTGGAGDVPRIPPFRFGGGLSWTSDRVDASFLALRSADQNHVPTGESTTVGFTQLNARIAWRPIADNRRVEIALIGRNLGDEVQRNAVAFNRDDVVLPGRDIRLLVRAGF